MSKEYGNIICVINARGGSAGLPRKNLKKVGGIPLVCRTVDIMLKAKTPDCCFVNTDDDEIAQLCRERGAEVPFKRPAELAGDDVPQYPVQQHSIKWYEETFERPVHILCHLQATGPFATAEDIDRCVRAAINDPECSAAVAVVEARHNPYFVMWEALGRYLEPVMRERGYGRPIADSDRHLLRRQDAPRVLQAAGTVWAIRRETVMKLGSAFGPRPVPVVVDSERFCEIDYEMDLILAQAQHKYLMKVGKITS